MTNSLGKRLVEAFTIEDPTKAKALCLEMRNSRADAFEVTASIEGLRLRVERCENIANKAGLESVLDELVRLVWVPQATVMQRIMPLIRKRGTRYRKSRYVQAKRATKSQEIVSLTSDGRETASRAAEGDFIVRNLTSARETYVVGAEKFQSRYERVRELEDGLVLYAPKGEVSALAIDRRVLRTLDRGELFYIEAPWGSPERAAKGDYLVTPPDMTEIYRIGRREFHETYKKVTESYAHPQ
jgi:hypothetical protein